MQSTEALEGRVNQVDSGTIQHAGRDLRQGQNKKNTGGKNGKPPGRSENTMLGKSGVYTAAAGIEEMQPDGPTVECHKKQKGAEGTEKMVDDGNEEAQEATGPGAPSKLTGAEESARQEP